MRDQVLTFFNRIAEIFTNFYSIYLPQIFAALIVIGVGWVVASLARKATYLLSRALGIDVISGRLGIDRLIAEGKLKRKPSQVAATVVFGLVWLTAVLIALDLLGLEAASTLVSDLFDYIPRLIVAFVMLGLGLYFVGFITALIDDFTSANRGFPRSLSPRLVRIGLSILVILAVLEHLGVGASFIYLGFAAISGGIALTAVLAFGLGLRPSIEDLIAGYTLRMHIRPGDRGDWKSKSVLVSRIGLFASELAHDQSVTIVPNKELLTAKLTVERKQD